MVDQLREESDEEIIRMRTQIRNLENYLVYMERQFERFHLMHPEFQTSQEEMGEETDLKMQQHRDNISQIAQLSNNSNLLKNYEYTIKENEEKLFEKDRLLEEMEGKVERLVKENGQINDQLFNKCKELEQINLKFKEPGATTRMTHAGKENIERNRYI